MRERDEPMTQTMKASEAKQQWGQLLNQVFRREKRILVEKSGIPVAAVISAADLEEFQRLEAQRARDFSIIDEIRAAFADQPDETIQREVDKAIAAVRARSRRRREETAPSP